MKSAQFILGYIVVVCSILLVGVLIGHNSASRKYIKENNEYQQKISEKKEELRILRENHINSQNEFTQELQEMKHEYENYISTLVNSFDDRMRESEERGRMYRERFTASSTQCGILAEHASRLDRSLTEGRELVRRLREDLEQFRMMCTQGFDYLIQDRNFLNDR